MSLRRVLVRGLACLLAAIAPTVALVSPFSIVFYLIPAFEATEAVDEALVSLGLKDPLKAVDHPISVLVFFAVAIGQTLGLALLLGFGSRALVIAKTIIAAIAFLVVSTYLLAIMALPPGL